jgi:hypothetical protein
VAELLGKVKSFEADETELLDAIHREEERLEGEGASIEDLDRLEQRFGGLEAQDGGFILDHERLSAQAKAEIEAARARVTEAEARVQRILDARTAAKEAARQWVVRGMGVAGAGVLLGIGLMFWQVLVGVAALVVVSGVGGILVLKGQRAAVAAEVLDADDLASARSEIAQLGERCEGLAAEQRSRDARLKDLARRCGYEQAEVLVDDSHKANVARK